MTGEAHKGHGAQRVGRAPWVLAALLVLLTALPCLLWTRDRAGVWLSAPLDDTFIHLQYAKQLARGRILQFNDGDSPTTGATSLLYLILLAPGWLVGLRGILLLVWAWGLNGLLQVLGGVAAFACIQRLTRDRALALLGQVAFLLSGPVIWGAFSHMEVALLSTLSLVTLHAALRVAGVRPDPAGEADPPHGAQASPDPDRDDGRQGMRRVLLWGCLLSWTRPEGALMAGGLSLWLLWRHLGQGQGSGRTSTGARVLALWQGRSLLLPLGSGLVMVCVFLVLTGRVSTNAAIKSHLTLLSHDPQGYVETTVRWLPMTLQILMEMWPRPVAPLLQSMLLLGLAGWAAAGSWRRLSPGALVVLWLGLLTLFYALAMARRDHFARYYIPYFGLALVATFWALGQVAILWPRLRRASVVAVALLLPFFLPEAYTWCRRYGDNCRDLAQQHFKVAAWVRANTPARSAIAVNDAGAIPYLAKRYSYDIVGLAHNAFYQLKKAIPRSNAPVWEALESLQRRPDYMVAYPEWIPDLYRLGLFEELKSFRLGGRTIVANETMVVWRLRWDWLLDAHRPPADVAGQRRVVDRLDVADVPGELAHAYALLDRRPPVGLVQETEQGSRWLVDGGRLVRDGERFVLQGIRPGEPATLLMRTRGPGLLQVEVLVDGKVAGWLREPRLAGGLSVASLSLPASLMRSSRAELRMITRRPYGSFHYWLLQ